MFEYSKRVIKKETKGGLKNVLYMISSVEELPDELTGIADNIYINFPWGNLLEAVLSCNEKVIKQVLKIAKPYAKLRICFSYSKLLDSG